MTGAADGRGPGRPEQAVPAGSVLPDSLRSRVVAVVGAGRLGTALVPALHAAGVEVTGPQPRGYQGHDADVVILCVPDDHIAQAASLLRPGLFVGHCSGATGLGVLQAGPADDEVFSLHPLITATGPGTVFSGAHAAVAAVSGEALAVANGVVQVLGMTAFAVAEEDRPAYHAAASMAANFLVTLEWAAARLLESASVDPAVVLPLARQALHNWAEIGPAALTGPVARGDLGTVAAHRVAIAERTPDLLPLFDELVVATRSLAQSRPDRTAAPQTVKGS